jgi:uncharacterized protein
MRIAITGATGLVGGELTGYFRSLGHGVTALVRPTGAEPAADGTVQWEPARGIVDSAGLEAHDVVVHLAGESIAGVWTSGRKRRIRESRVKGTALLASSLAALREPPRALFTASGVHVYGDERAGTMDESSEPGSGFMADVVRAWEAAAEPARDAGIRVVHMRFGNVLSPRGGLLATLLPLFRLGLGARMGSGRQVWPWIAAEEIAPALLHVLERPELAGPVNFVAPEQVTNREFTESLAAALNRPAAFQVPRFVARLAPGGMGEELLLWGVRVRPAKLEETGYAFRFPELEPALRSMLARPE